MRQVLDTLVEGKSIEHKVTLPEGLTSYQIVQRLMAHPELKGEITEIPPEGSLLPDTYGSAATTRARTSSTACGRRRRSSSPKCGRPATRASW